MLKYYIKSKGKNMLKISLIFVTVVYIFSGCSNKELLLTHDLEKKEGIYSLKKAKRINMKELVKEIENYPIVFVGDHHNTEKTHNFFENLLKELDKSGTNLLLANEWFTPQHDKLLKDFTDGKIDSNTLKEKRKWDEFTKYKWEYVEPLYQTVKKNGGRLLGMNMSKIERKKISLKQFDQMSKEEKTFYDSLDLNVTAHNQLVMPYLKHCNKMPPSNNPEPCEERMYRVQVAWDTYMAKNVAKIASELIKKPNDKLLVFVGAMHIEQNLGIPLRFSRFSNLPFITISNENIQKDKDLKLDVNKADIVYIYEH